MVELGSRNGDESVRSRDGRLAVYQRFMCSVSRDVPGDYPRAWRLTRRTVNRDYRVPIVRTLRALVVLRLRKDAWWGK